MRRRFGLRFSESDDIKKLQAIIQLLLKMKREVFSVTEKYGVKQYNIEQTLTNPNMLKIYNGLYNDIQGETGRLAAAITRYANKIQSTIDKLK